MEDEDYERKKPNSLPIWGNVTTMNMNPLILTNIQQSPYFKGPLSELKTYHEVVDEIYYKVNHLEPWEKGSRRTAGQTGMCGGVRGVGAGGTVSTAFCLLYKLFTLRLTRKQVMGLVNHGDSPYIRALGFMYIRFTQPPPDLWDWFDPYIDDAEVVDVRAGGGQEITIGEMVRLFLTKLDWYSSLFPRIPVPIQIGIDRKLAALKLPISTEPLENAIAPPEERVDIPPSSSSRRDIPYNNKSRSRSRSRSRDRYRGRDSRRDDDRHGHRRDKDKERERDRERRRSRSRSRSPHHRRHGHSKESSRRKERDGR